MAQRLDRRHRGRARALVTMMPGGRRRRRAAASVIGSPSHPGPARVRRRRGRCSEWSRVRVQPEPPSLVSTLSERRFEARGRRWRPARITFYSKFYFIILKTQTSKLPPCTNWSC